MYEVVSATTGALLPVMFVHMPNATAGSVDDDVEVLHIMLHCIMLYNIL